MQRGQAFAHDGAWCGYAVFPGGASTGWHHHGDYATYAHITDGEMTIAFGPGGAETGRGPSGRCGLHPGPPRALRDRRVRRAVPGSWYAPAETGATVHNVDRPNRPRSKMAADRRP